MRKPAILALCIAILAASAAAQMECSVVPPNICDGTKIIGMTSLSTGGSHASIPTDQANALVACCKGVEGLSVSYAHEGADIYLTSARDAHVSRVSGENGLKINGVSCGYFNNCNDYDACVFSISADRDAHISDCGNYAFTRKLCCREGALIGEELEIEQEAAAEEEQAIIPASPEEGMGNTGQNNEIAQTSKPRSIKFTPILKKFIRNFLRGGLVGSFLRIPA
ncbi:MAG: hypothetical protein KJ955_08740 [Nanoarchaeota archaeon]|nr:hypothetical protein [Nanoarchaeota archaeon]